MLCDPTRIGDFTHFANGFTFSRPLITSSDGTTLDLNVKNVASGYPQISRVLETLKLPAFPTKKEEFLRSLMMHIPYVVQDTWSRPAYATQRSRSTRSRHQSLPLRIFLATTFTLVAVLVSLSVCKNLLIRHRLSGLAPRKLSEGGEAIDGDEHAILEGCLALEEEMGIIEERTFSSPEGDASSRIMELVSMLSETAAAKESTQGESPLADKLHLSQQLLEGPSPSEPTYYEEIHFHTPSPQSSDASSRTMELASMLSETATPKESTQGESPLAEKLHLSQQLLEGPSPSEPTYYGGIHLLTPSPQSSDASSRTMELVSMLSETAAAKESTQGESPLADKLHPRYYGEIHLHTPSPQSSDASSRIMELASMLSETAAAKESTQGESSLADKLHVSQQLLEGPSPSDPRDCEGIHLHTPSPQSSVKSTGSTGGSPALDPDSWIETIPSIDAQLVGQEGAESSSATEGDSSTEEVSAPPAIKRRREDLRDLLLGDNNRSHPYVRLPVVEKGVAPRYIRTSILFTRPTGRISPHMHLREVRRLLKKETIDQHDAEVLMNAVERLVSASWFNTQTQTRTLFPVDIVSVLGKYFMIFDAIVSAMQLFGEYMQAHLWWDKFTAHFDTSVRLYSTASYQKVAKFHVYLAKRLSSALDIYKQGRRPPRLEVYELKRLLFCSPLGHHRLKEQQWEPWREDGGCI
ncbi:hypothetical protein EBH_0013820 [Eimeria brunetti]|uniref:Uncharacterized protein n=1 Tax=Eimeria brunetti TaxID=51314 RepID=U6LE72_9EIME|nr:hypothetical protein EBH_0013820 [Eimeria brunetti]